MLCDPEEVVLVEEMLGYLSDLYDIAFGVHRHDDPKNVVSTVAYHDPEGLFDQDVYGKKVKMYVEHGVSKVHSFKSFMELTTYETRVLLETLSKLNKAEARKPSKMKQMGKELDAILKDNE